MIGILKHIVFRSILIVVLLHTLIPHRHYDEMSEVEHFELHQNNNSIVGLLEIFFHENNDESLDNLLFAQFNTKESLQHHITSSPLFTILLDFFDEEKLKLSTRNTESSLTILFVKLNGLRGPPTSLLT